MIGDYANGASYCQKAIEIDPARHNAYKNLGISMEGMGSYIEAAQSYITATKTCLPGFWRAGRTYRHDS
jgi:tetratricopeptide (TPR) repeat protein